MSSQENARPRSRAPGASRARNASSSRTCRSAAAQATGSWVSRSSPLSPVGDDRRQPAHRGGDHGGAGGLGLGGDEPEGLVVRRHGDHRCGRVPDRASSAGGTGGTNRTTSSISSRRPARRAPRGARARSRRVRRRSGRRVATRRSGVSSSSTATACSSTSGALSGCRPAGEQHDVGVRRQAEVTARRRRCRGDGRRSGRHPECTTSTRPGSASYRLISCLASMSVLAISMSAASTTCSSPMIRATGSGVSPTARASFLTLAIVCMVCTSGTPHRSRASAPTWPESQ